MLKTTKALLTIKQIFLHKSFVSLLILTSFFIQPTNSQPLQETINSVDSLFNTNKFNEVITILEQKKKTDSLTMEEYYLLTKSYGRIRQYSNGFVLSQIMLNKASNKKDTTNLIIAANLMIENLVDLNKIDTAIKVFDNSLPFFRKKDSIAFQKMCFKGGVALFHAHRYEEAYKVYNQITKKEYRELSLFTNNYALTLMGLGRHDEALFYFKKSVAINKQKKESPVVPYGNIAEIYMKKKKWKLAESYLDSSFRALDEKSQLTNRKYIYEQYFQLYIKQNKVNQALVYLENIRRVDQKIFDKRINEKIVEIDNTYERENKLKKEVKLIDDQLASSEKQKLWGAIFALLAILGLISTAFYFKYKNIASAHEQIRTEQKLLRSQMTPHFIFNSLSVLQGMILNKEDKKAVRYLSKFSKLLRLMLESSREKLVPLRDELLALKNYVELQNLQAKSGFIVNFNVDENIDEEALHIPPMLIQPFVENAIEHGFKEAVVKPELHINLTFDNDNLICEILDNGIGITNSVNSKTKTTSKKSLATKITTERLKIFAKEYNTSSNLLIEDRKKHNEQGTKVLLTLPYKIL